MMNLTLSWDLFIAVFFALVITYSFIIGKKESIRIIVSCYVALVAVQALGGFFDRIFGFTETQSLLASVGVPLDTTVTAVIKLTVFVVLVVFIMVRAGLHVQYANNGKAVTNVVIAGLAGFATAGLLLATLLTFIGGSPLLDMHITATPVLAAVLKQSQLMTIMMQNLDLWFTLPALVIVAGGVFSKQ